MSFAASYNVRYNLQRISNDSTVTMLAIAAGAPNPAVLVL